MCKSGFNFFAPLFLSEEVGDEQTLAQKRNNSALNVAKLLRKSISKHNLFAASPEPPEAHRLKEQTQLNGHASSPHTNTNGHTHPSPEKDVCSSAHPDLQADPVNQKHSRKKDSCSLETVTEEIGVNGEAEDRYCWTVQIFAIYLTFMLFLRICGLDLYPVHYVELCHYKLQYISVSI